MGKGKFIRNLSIIMVLMVLSILFVSGCATTRGDWENTTRLNTVWAYESFLIKHPQSEFTADAKRKVEELKWGEVKKANEIKKYKQFIEDYPTSIFTNEALKQLREMEVREWQEAKAGNTLEGYDKFIKLFPKSDKLSELKEKSRDILSQIAIESAGHKENIISGRIDIAILVDKILRAEKIALKLKGDIVELTISQNAKLFSQSDLTVTFYQDPTNELLFEANINEIAITKKESPPYGGLYFAKSSTGQWKKAWDTIVIGPESKSGLIYYGPGHRAYFTDNKYTPMKIKDDRILYRSGTGIVIVEQNGKKQVWNFVQ